MSRRVALTLGTLFVAACSGGTPVGGSTPAPGGASTTAPGQASSATQAEPTGGAPAPAPGGVTTFHLVVSDGPKAGTYDVSTNDPNACHVGGEGYFIASYMLTTEPGLDYIEGNLQPRVTGLKYGFDVETDDKLIFVGDGEVDIDLDDRGSTATMTVTSESNIASAPDGSVIDTGEAVLTVECGSVLRPG